MENDRDHGLSDERRIALSHTPADWRPALTSFLNFDALLGRIAGQTSEVILGQMRLAWWRDRLAEPVEQRPGGDAVLDAISRHWRGEEAALIALVDGWEVLVASETMGSDSILDFARGRAAPFVTLAGNEGRADRIEAAGLRWACADAAANLTDETERALFIETALAQPRARGRLPKSLRGLAVLEALAERALKRGGCPLMEGRGAALTAMRAAIAGA
jgi:phytoene synthase